jgi:hypothetical protein
MTWSSLEKYFGVRIGAEIQRYGHISIPFHSRSATNMAYILGHILQNIRLQWHLHVYGASYPAQLSLPDIKHSFNSLCFLFANLCTCPSLCGYFIDSWFYLGEAQKVHIAILLLVRALLVEDKGL